MSFGCSLDLNCQCLDAQTYGTSRCLSVSSYLDTEVASVYVVPQKEVACVGRRTAHFKQLHQIEELTVDVSAHCGHSTDITVHMLKLHRDLRSSQIFHDTKGHHFFGFGGFFFFFNHPLLLATKSLPLI